VTEKRAASIGVAFVESLDQEGIGVAHVDGKVTFIEGAITGETVAFARRRSRGNFDLATATDVLAPSAMRVSPRCAYFGLCGGCAMQHLEASAQHAVKHRDLDEPLARNGNVAPETILPPIYGSTWGYRQRARLSVHFVVKKGGVLVGFHEKRSSFVADIRSCEVLPPAISALIVPLRELFTTMALRDRLPQVEVAVGDRVTVLVLRHLDPLTPPDEERLRHFADRRCIQWWLQPKGPETAHPFYPMDAPALDYVLPEFGLRMGFGPTEFTQVNALANRALVRRAMGLLAPAPGERIGDLFCGLGNFTLPMAARGAQAVGMEGSAALTARGEANARANGLAERASFIAYDLYKDAPGAMARLGPVAKLLIAPPRDGALEICRALPDATASSLTAGAPWRIVYVSCNPATLARDANLLVNVKGYRLVAAGIANLFPHTGHVESVALFEQPPK
jgi:23S rRNA (uracil1939-C5)-methyltransferase